jgi:demethoxyubiquinone hydroxylase (CLK1/Coq7/Cat5 family)
MNIRMDLPVNLVEPLTVDDLYALGARVAYLGAAWAEVNVNSHAEVIGGVLSDALEQLHHEVRREYGLRAKAAHETWPESAALAVQRDIDVPDDSLDDVMTALHAWVMSTVGLSAKVTKLIKTRG